MELLYLSLLIGGFLYVFVYRSRYCYGTRTVLKGDDGYTVITWWGKEEIMKDEIEKEKDMKVWDLAFNFDYNLFRTRTYLLRPSGRVRAITMKEGFIKHHLIPLAKIKEGRSNQALDSIGTSSAGPDRVS